MAGVVALLCVVAGCDEEKGFNERRALRERDVVTARNVVSRDLERGVRGVQRAAQLVARRFPDPDPERRERALRQLLVRTRQPPRAIEELLTSPVTFVAAVGTDGRVVARDAEPDPMRGYDLGAAAPIVRRALVEGVAGYALSELPGTAEGEQTSVTVVFAAPARREGQIVGAVAAGIPLWRLAQQLSRQLQLENAAALQRGELLWALVYKGDRLHHHAGFPPGLVELTPSASVRSQALAASPGGYTAEVQQYGRWYGYLVLPLPRIGEDAGMILYRSDAF
jgi:hypothetical protein